MDFYLYQSVIQNDISRVWSHQAAMENSSQDVQNERLQATNERLLKLLENHKNRSDQDRESELYWRLCSHQPTSYNGEADPIKFEDWIDKMEKILGVVNCPEDLMSKLASFYLEGPMGMWWKTVKKEDQFIGLS